MEWPNAPPSLLRRCHDELDGLVRASREVAVCERHVAEALLAAGWAEGAVSQPGQIPWRVVFSSRGLDSSEFVLFDRHTLARVSEGQQGAHADSSVGPRVRSQSLDFASP